MHITTQAYHTSSMAYHNSSHYKKKDLIQPKKSLQ